MRLLLDTHALLWYTQADPLLSDPAKTAILDPDNQILLSPASYWELAVKVSIGKLVLNQPYETFIEFCLSRYRFAILPIEPKHTAALIALPFHHKDPFDRLLVAQAMVEGIPLISNDAILDSYPVERLW